MRAVLKWGCIALVTVVIALGCVAAYVATAFDPNDYKSQLVRAVQERTGRTLDLKGRIALTFYPSLGVKIGEATLSERQREREFARVADARLAIKLIPLLSKRVVVDAIEVKGLRAALIRDTSGRYNFDDLARSEGKASTKGGASSFTVDIAEIKLSQADITYIDQRAGAQYRVANLKLRTGRIAKGVATPIEFSALLASPKDNALLDTTLKATLTFDSERGFYKLEKLDFATKGKLAGFSGLNMSAKGDVEARAGAGELVTRGLSVALSTKDQSGELKAKLDSPSLVLTTEKVAGDKLALEATRQVGRDRSSLKVTIAGVQGTFKSLRAGPLDAVIETQGERVLKAHLTGTLVGNLAASRLELPNMKLTARVSNPTLPNGGIDASLGGSLRADLARETASLEFAGTFDRSKVAGTAAIRKFSPFAFAFHVDADQFDADRFLASGPKSDTIDLSALNAVNGSGTLRIGRLTLLGLKASQFRADVQAANGRLTAAPLHARLYDGSLNGSLSAQSGANPVFTIRQTLAGVAVGPLLRDAAQIDTLEGKATVTFDMTTRGATVDALKKALSGTAAVSVTDGALKGFDIAGAIRGARSKLSALRGEQVHAADRSARTDFSEMKATFDVKNGVAHNEDFSMKSPLLRAAGAGDLDLGHDRMNYLLKATVVATSKGQGGKDLSDLSGLTLPVRLSGALESPQYAIDFGGMATELAKRQVQDQLLRRTSAQNAQTPSTSPSSNGGKVEDVLKGLKSIFTR